MHLYRRLFLAWTDIKNFKEWRKLDQAFDEQEILLIVLATLFFSESIAVTNVSVKHGLHDAERLIWTEYGGMATTEQGTYMCASSSSRCWRCFFSFSFRMRSLYVIASQPCGLLSFSDIQAQIDKTYFSISFCLTNMFSCADSFFVHESLWWGERISFSFIQ